MIQFMMNIFSTVTETVSRQSSITIRVGAGYGGNVRHNFNSLHPLMRINNHSIKCKNTIQSREM